MIYCILTFPRSDVTSSSQGFLDQGDGTEIDQLLRRFSQNSKEPSTPTVKPNNMGFRPLFQTFSSRLFSAPAKRRQHCCPMELPDSVLKMCLVCCVTIFILPADVQDQAFKGVVENKLCYATS